MCEPAALVESDEEPELMSEPDEDIRPQRERTAPGRYNPESGSNYAHVVACNNLVTQVGSKRDTLLYEDFEAGILAQIVVEKCHLTNIYVT